jgi:hypothetical protein
MQQALLRAPASVLIVNRTEEAIRASRLRQEFTRAPPGYGIRSYGLDDQHKITMAVSFGTKGADPSACSAQVMFEFAEGPNLLALIMLEKRDSENACRLSCMRDPLAEYHPLVGQARRVIEESGCIGAGDISADKFVLFAKRIFDSFSRFTGSN